jgi:hypothetical protein
VFGMGTGGSLSLWSPRTWVTKGLLNILTGHFTVMPLYGSASNACCARSKFYGQAEWAISNGQLNVLPHLHIRPIKLVVYQCPSNFRWEISS